MLRTVATLLFCSFFALLAQTSGKRPLTHNDYDAWRSINSQALSPDGRYLAYAFMPLSADGDLIVRDLTSGQEWKSNVGTLPPPPVIQPGELLPDQEPPRRTIRIVFTSDSKYVVAGTYPTKAETDAAKKAKKRAEEMPKPGLIVVTLANGESKRVADVRGWQVPLRGGDWLAYQKEPPPPPQPAAAKKPAAPADDDDDADQAQRGGAGAAGARPGASPADRPSDLVLVDLATWQERALGPVTEFNFARDGKTLVYAASRRPDTENGVYAVTPGSDAAPVALLTGKGKYSKLAWDQPQKQVAFLSSRDDAESKQPKFKAYLWDRQSPQPVEVVSAAIAGFPQGMAVSDKGSLAFSRDGKRLFVPVGTPPKESLPAESGAEEKVLMDLWRWNDDYVQPMQKVRANQERNRTYRGAYDIATKRYVQLADASLQDVTTDDSGLRAVGVDTKPYRRMVDYDGNFADIYVVDGATGARKIAAKQLRTGFGAGTSFSPDGRTAVFFRDCQWHALDTATGAVKSITSGIATKFCDEEDDTPDPPSSYGSAGWTKDGKGVLLYDRYDLWLVSPDGAPAKNLTAGAGRREKMQYRVQRMTAGDEEGEEDNARYFDSSKPLYLRGESQKTRATGFFKTTYAGNAAPQRLLWGDANYRVVGQARTGDVVLLTASRFDQFPDLHVTNTSFQPPRKVSDGDAQRSAFTWGTAEMISFTSAKGAPLQAVLYKPENFDPKKKYPLMVYIYEKLSQNLNNFTNPQPGTSINISYYVSNGYLVLTPDIVYAPGLPGQSALDCVLPAIAAIEAKGFVNPNAIGIQGHSWGGYQIAYMVTKTDKFKAAEAGAPVGNMTSAYSGIRWGTGLPRQFQYEKTQSRIGKTLYSAPQEFLANSAVFGIQNVKTPLLILHNDQDDAVPWYQGIELFLALRRNNKEAYLFNYNGEFHGLRRRYNQEDWTVRMQQFFDHKLKGAPAPEWMEKGVPYIDREEEKERFQKAVSDHRP